MKVTLLRLVMAMALSGFVLGVPGSYAADDTKALKQQVDQLSSRIADLEKQLAQKNAAPQPQVQQLDSDAGWYNQPMWDPFMEMDMMQRQMHRMMGAMRDDAFMNPNVDIKQSPKEYIITMDIPGMNKNNIEVKVEGKSLVVSGERSSSRDDQDKGKLIHQERAYSNFMRVVPLPPDAKADSINADYKNGVLNVHVGRNPQANKPASQKIEVK